MYKETGPYNYKVQKAATVNASKTHAIMNGLGTIEMGIVTNLLLVDKNPLVDLSVLQKLRAVFIKGRKLDRETLDKFETKERNRNNLIASAIRYVENLLVEK